MKQTLRSASLVAAIAVVVLLQGCAAATVIREQPDFNDENQRRLQQSFGIDQIAVRAADPSRQSSPAAAPGR